MSGDQFWRATPRELWLEFLAARARRQEEEERDLSHAWHVALFERQTKLPSLASLLGRVSVAPVQDSRQMGTVLGIMTEQYGWRARKKKTKES